VADPWITLAAIASATEGLRFGPMVTPLARRRPPKVAKETATLDRFSGGRLTLGVGLGSDRFAGELSATGEELDDRRRGQMLDESLEILTAAWSGEPVRHHGRHYTVDGVSFLPRPVQRPGVPVWAAGFPGNAKPLRRAARHDGWTSAMIRFDDLRDTIGKLTALRAELGRADDPFEIQAVCIDRFGLDGYRAQRDIGVTDAIVVPWLFDGIGFDGPLAAKQDSMHRFAEKIITRM
jgi:alkanesulfonate monooxygenase SsuD/methylene tetrahydromethanopterin reductase-like flavin-dependent oxidoreductase (luciferase family)